MHKKTHNITLIEALFLPKLSLYKKKYRYKEFNLISFHFSLKFSFCLCVGVFINAISMEILAHFSFFFRFLYS